jgi:anti-sigma factor RsiW
VRCSSCEPLLDRYVEGTLTPSEMARVKAHLKTCPHCESLLTEVRVVDALLATTKPANLAPNFTFALMAEVRAMPARTQRSLSVWGVLALYVVAAWIAISGIYIALGGRIPYVDSMREAFTATSSQSLAALSATAQGLGPAAPLVLGGVVTVLSIDALLIIGAIVFYRAARSRLATQPQRSEAV